jgi:signal peptidase II
LTARRGPTWFWLAGAGILVADLVTKNIVYHSETLRRGPVRVLGDWLVLNYIHNAGSAFGLFHGSRWFFIGVSAVSILLILSLALSGRYRDRWIYLAFGMILGGAVGNLLDRIWLGVVIDFLDLGIGSHRWPIFNVADIGVTAGVILLALRLLLDQQEASQDEADRGEAGRTGSGPPPEEPAPDLRGPSE